MDDRLDTDLLAELIGKKHAILEKVRDLSRRQSDLIGDGNMTRLMSVLSAKEKLLTSLQDLQRKLNPFRNQDPDARKWRSPEDRQRCQQLSSRCEALIGEIMLVEKRSERELVQQRDVVAARLQRAHSSAQASRAYAASPVPESRKLDLSSES